MSWVVGLDGCRGGWLAVTLREKEPGDVAVFPHIQAVWQARSQAALMLIDIPIGLRDSGRKERLCDVAARRLLGFPRGASVFPAPCRPALGCLDYRQASEHHYSLCGSRLSLQSWGLTAKIREVDVFLRQTPAARQIVRETHPELLFWALNQGRAMVHKKSRPEGLQERLEVLRQYYSASDILVAHGLRTLPRSQAAAHDLLDALAAAVTARLGRQRLITLPPVPEYDAYGLPMEIVYFFPG